MKKCTTLLFYVVNLKKTHVKTKFKVFLNTQTKEIFIILSIVSKPSDLLRHCEIYSSES